MTKPKFPVPADMLVPMPDKVSPPKGVGRPKGSRNLSTATIKEAIMAVYRDLQENAGGGNAHFLAWAAEHPGQFYRMWMRLLPFQPDAQVDGPMIGTVVFVRDHG